MSHAVTINLQIRDLAAVRAAVKRLGGIWHEGQKTYAWYGRSVGDYPIPEGFTKEQLGKCDHAFGFPGSKYEVGVCKKPDGTYTLIWDFWNPGDGGLIPHMGNEQAHKFCQAYGVEKAKLEARKAGYLARETIQADGSIRVVCSKIGG